MEMRDPRRDDSGHNERQLDSSDAKFIFLAALAVSHLLSHLDVMLPLTWM